MAGVEEDEREELLSKKDQMTTKAFTLLKLKPPGEKFAK